MKKIRSKKQFIIIMILAILILGLIILISTIMGSANISASEAIKIIASKIPFLSKLINIENTNYETIITKIRIPRILLAGLVGMALSVCGAVYQGTLKNSMADPYILGISSGAALGATISIITGELISTKILAFLLAIVVTVFVYVISSKTVRKDSTYMILTGININYLVTAIVSLLMIINRDQLQKIMFWTMGSFSSAIWKDVIILAIIVVPASIIIALFGKYINAIALDEKTAKTIGINTNYFRGIMILVTCLITSLCVSVSGIIGFVGLMIPHIVRLLFTTDYRYLIPISGVVGAIFLIISDDIARLAISPSEIPIGIITAILGAPYLIYLIYKKRITN